MEARQLFGGLTATAPQPTGNPLVGRNCNGLNLPVGGVLSMPNGDVVTLTAAAAFKPVCTPVTPPAIIANGGGGSVTIDDTIEGSMPTDDGWTYSDFQDPFYASTFPQCYALAATTVVAYTLVIMLLVTPRSFLDGGVVVLGRRGFTNGGTGATIGGRPWLQKVAALTVAISLTIASAATFSAAEAQYSFGVQNAKRLQVEVLGGNELKIIRIISNTFLWLAQAQTLIRLFPRQREKVIIKWTAFALITLDVIFQSLNSFQYEQGVARPGDFQHAVPALSYLFALSLGVLYAAWVIYYSLLKKRYAFWHPQMKNMCLMAALSLLAILIPVVFFILDIVQPDFTGWGEYVRWVGAAAASVIVWEWVERIEALEREEKKDGILGREVFDGDEMLDLARSNHGLRRRRKEADDVDKEVSIKSGRDDTPSASSRASDDGGPSEGGDASSQPTLAAPVPQKSPSYSRWRALTRHMPFQNTRPTDVESAEPVSVDNASRKEDGGGAGSSSSSKWDFRERLEDFAATQAERLRERFRTTPDTDSLPVTVIPAPPRRGAALAQLLEEEEREAQQRSFAPVGERRETGDEPPAAARPRPQLRPIVMRDESGSSAGGRRLSVPLTATPVSPSQGLDVAGNQSPAVRVTPAASP
ncbi:hypothetical protein NEMBOFW57_000678 [Staphylotrichum longicolle]|uniref:Uncharacterized protein n=1 Tax=Staphylotrichum longicolle TaxID=669026 RepID=A0AAD4F0Y5_9PEZI|nr:hypothetical protein NEMBOFW57_000678 [Staphylotrichum longicolle]